MAWTTKAGTGTLIMASGDTLATGVVSAQTGRFNQTFVNSGFTMPATSVATIPGVSVRSLSFIAPVLATSASVGSSAALPATPECYVTIVVSGNQLKIPAYRL